MAKQLLGRELRDFFRRPAAHRQVVAAGHLPIVPDGRRAVLLSAPRCRRQTLQGIALAAGRRRGRDGQCGTPPASSSIHDAPDRFLRAWPTVGAVYAGGRHSPIGPTSGTIRVVYARGQSHALGRRCFGDRERAEANGVAAAHGQRGSQRRLRACPGPRLAVSPRRTSLRRGESLPRPAQPPMAA